MTLDSRTLRWTRYTAYGLNTVIVIVACVTIATGCRMWRIVPGNLTKVNPKIDPTGEATGAAIFTLFQRGVGLVHSVANTLITAGCFAILGGLFGVVASYRNSKNLLLAYMVIFVIVVIMELGAGVAMGLYAPKIGPSLTQTFRYSLAAYDYQKTTVDSQGRVSIIPYSGTDPAAIVTTAIVNHLHTTVGCCGYDHHGYTDLGYSPYWKVSQEPPIFCCKFSDKNQLILEDPSCAVKRTPENSWMTMGCVDKICDWIDFSFNPVMAVSVGIGLFNIFGVVVAGYQYFLLRRTEYKEFE